MKHIQTYQLTNKNGLSLEVLNLGGIIRSLHIPDANGVFSDVVLGFQEPKDYLNNSPYFGAIIGRYANRIDKGKFELNGKTYALETNNPPNHLHGGIKGFDRVFWNVTPYKEDEGLGLLLTYLSKDGEEGYPGNLEIEVRYLLSEDNFLKVKYKARTDKATPINFTQHSYFNLSGNENELVNQHNLQIKASAYLPVNPNLIPLGLVKEVNGTAFDFNVPKSIGAGLDHGDDQLDLCKGYDHSWVLCNNKSIEHVAQLNEPISGRVLNLYTDQPALHVYSANFIEGIGPNKKGEFYKNQTGLCLETQHFADSPNQKHFPNTILKPNEEYKSETWFQFSTL